MHKKTVVAAIAAAGFVGTLLAASFARDLHTVPVETGMQGQKLDSELGELPHFRPWAALPRHRQLVQQAATPPR